MGKQDLGSYYDPNQSNVNNHNFPNQIARNPTPDVSVVNPQNVKHASHYSKSSNSSVWRNPDKNYDLNMNGSTNQNNIFNICHNLSVKDKKQIGNVRLSKKQLNKILNKNKNTTVTSRTKKIEKLGKRTILSRVNKLNTIGRTSNTFYTGRSKGDFDNSTNMETPSYNRNNTTRKTKHLAKISSRSNEFLLINSISS